MKISITGNLSTKATALEKADKRFRRHIKNGVVMKHLKKSIDMDALLPHLISNDYTGIDFTDLDNKKLCNKYSTNKKRKKHLFSLLEKGGPSAYRGLLQCMEEEKTHPPHNQFLRGLPPGVYTPQQPLLELPYPNSKTRNGKKQTDEKMEIVSSILHIRTKQMRPQGCLAGVGYSVIMTRIQEHHYYGNWAKADELVEKCRHEHEELYMAAKLRNFSYHVTNNKMPKEDIVCNVKHILEWCSRTTSDNSRIIESKCLWVLAKGCRYAKKMDEAESYIDQAIQLQFACNFEPGEDVGCSSYCKASILNSKLTKVDSQEQYEKLRKGVNDLFEKAIENVTVCSDLNYGLPICQPVIRLAQMNLYCSPHEAGTCSSQDRIEKAQDLLTRIETEHELLKPRIQCLFCIAKSDLFRNKQERAKAEYFLRRAEGISCTHQFEAEMDTVRTRLAALSLVAKK